MNRTARASLRIPLSSGSSLQIDEFKPMAMPRRIKA